MEGRVEPAVSRLGFRRRCRHRRSEEPRLQTLEVGGRLCRRTLRPVARLSRQPIRSRVLPRRMARCGRRGDCLVHQGKRVVLAERLQELDCRRRRVIRSAHHDGAHERGGQRLRRSGVQAAPIEKAGLVQGGVEPAPKPGDEAQALGVGRGGCGGVQLVRTDVRRGQVLDGPERRRPETRRLHRLAEVAGSRGGRDRLGDRAEEHGQADVLGQPRASLAQKSRGRDRPGQLVRQDEVDRHVAGVPEDRSVEPHA